MLQRAHAASMVHRSMPWPLALLRRSAGSDQHKRVVHKIAFLRDVRCPAQRRFGALRNQHLDSICQRNSCVNALYMQAVK